MLATLGGGTVLLAGCIDSAETDSDDENANNTETNETDDIAANETDNIESNETDDTETDETDDTEADETVYESLVLFRSDDIAPWTDLEPLRAVNDLFIKHDVPVTQAIVPHDKNENESLDTEHEVCHYLTELDAEHGELFENSLHGFDHGRETDFYGVSEFGDLPYDEQKQRLTDGYEILDDCVEMSKTFAPPFNTYDRKTVEVLVEEEFKLVSGGLEFQDEYFGERGFWEDENIIHLPVTLLMEDQDTEEVRDVTTLKEEYDQNKEEFGINNIMLHYHFYADDEEQQKLEEIIQYATEDDSRFLTLGEFANKVANESISRTEDGWRIED